MTQPKAKIFVITGGAGLIGKAILKKLKEQYTTVINADINVQDDVTAQTVHCDVTNEQSITKMLQWVADNFGGLDGIVNNAYPRTKDWGKRFEEIVYTSWQENVNMQLNSTFLLCQKVVPFLTKRNGGVILNIGSIYGVVGPDFTVYENTPITNPAAYSAIKGGIINFTRYLASYLGSAGIRVNCVSPGGIFDNQHPSFVENYSKKVPMKRMGTPEDIAGPVAFLLSDDAAYITGQNLLVDGGWTSI